MAVDHSKRKFYEAHEDNGYFQFRVYHYDTTGNHQVFVHQSDLIYDTSEAAEDAAVEWCDENGIDAEMS